jgi:hypothetical protein
MMDTETTALATTDPIAIWTWTPLAKGEVQACVCDQEGCCTIITVLDGKANVLEIYQGSLASLWSCIARVVLPDDMALCRKLSPAQRQEERGV